MTRPGAAARPSRLWRFLAIGVVALAVAWGIAHVVGSRRTAAMRAAAETARSAVTAARAAEAMTWAPDRLLAAEHAWRGALAAQRVEEARLWLVPDAPRVVEAFSSAERVARDALAQAR